jgi:RHS repeat-associated protein
LKELTLRIIFLLALTLGLPLKSHAQVSAERACADLAAGCLFIPNSFTSPQPTGGYRCLTRSDDGQVHDTGFAFGCTPDAGDPEVPKRPFPDTDKADNKCGSIIQVDNLAVGEAVDLVGSSDQLTYFTNRVFGRTIDYTINIPAIANTANSTEPSRVLVELAGNQYTHTFNGWLAPAWIFQWDGRDSASNIVPGAATAKITYIDVAPAFRTNTFYVPVGGWKSYNFGLGGWSLSSLHFFDSARNKLFLGSGEMRFAEALAMYQDSSGKIRSPDLFDPLLLPNVYVVTSASGHEAYIFGLDGKHLQTRSTRTGQVLKTFSYVSAFNLDRIIDSFGNVTQVTRSGSQILISAPHGQVTTLNLNADLRAESIIDPGGRRWEMTYNDAGGLLKTFKQPSGAVSTLTYDSGGLLARDSSSAGSFWDILYSSDGPQRSINMTSAEGRTYAYTVSALMPDSYVRSEVEPGGARTTTEYYPHSLDRVVDPSGQVSSSSIAGDMRFQFMTPIDENMSITTPSTVSTQRAETRTPTFDPNDFLNLTSEAIDQTIDGYTWQSVYSNATQSYINTSPMGRSSKLGLNSSDQPISFQSGNFLPVNINYDGLGRVELIQQGTRATFLEYGVDGFVKKVTNPLGQSTQFAYNPSGQVTTQTLPDGRIIALGYDSNGNLSSITPPSRPSHNFVYNLFDLVANYLPPAISGPSGNTLYTYNNDRQITGITRADNSVVNFNYITASGLLGNINTVEGTYTRSYNSANQLTNITAPSNVALTWGYDGNLVTRHSTSFGTVTVDVNYTFVNMLPSVQKVSTPAPAKSSSTVAISYDQDRLVSAVGGLTITRDAVSGLVTATSLGNIQEFFSYDSQFGELAEYRATNGVIELYKELYTRDPLGRIVGKAVTTNGITTTLSYVFDSAGRLTQVFTNGVLSTTYTYDANSNRTKMVRGTKTTKATYDAQDRMLTYGGRKYTYTAMGDRLLRYTDTNISRVEYRYDSLGALAQAIRTTKSATTGLAVTDTFDYLNDGLGRRIERKKNLSLQERYVYDESGRLIAELSTTGRIKYHFVYATMSHSPDYLIQGANRFKFIHDHLGSVRMVVNATTGEVKSRMDYDEFGVLLPGSLASGFTPFGFAGGIRDAATGLVRFGARDYDPGVGRWTSKDPILFGGGDTNLYSYTFADPVNFIDPMGLYGTGDCSYYGGRCTGSGGDYYCSIAPWACKKAPSDPDPDKGWGNCTWQCLQDEDKKNTDTQKSCPPEPDTTTDNFWDGGHFNAHVKCYLQCTNRLPNL